MNCSLLESPSILVEDRGDAILPAREEVLLVLRSKVLDHVLETEVLSTALMAQVARLSPVVKHGMYHFLWSSNLVSKSFPRWVSGTYSLSYTCTTLVIH